MDETGSAGAWPRAIAGTAAVALVLAASRWGTYIGVGPIYLTDVLIALSLTASLVASLSHVKPPAEVKPRVPLSYRLFVGYVVLVGLMTVGRDPILTWARDLVPFLYASLALLSANSMARASDRALVRTYRLIKWALAFHAVWMLVVLLLGRRQVGLFNAPFVGAPVMQIRPDFDGAILAVTAGLLLRALLHSDSQHKFRLFLGVAACSGGVVMLPSRASLISLACVLFLTAVAGVSAAVGKRQVAVLLSALAFLAMVVAVVPQTTPGERLLSTLGLQQAQTAGQINAQGTERAREQTWSGINRWSSEDEVRRYFGSGFGNDFLTQAGVIANLEGSTYDNVRSPHNYFVGVLARLGLVGVLLSVLVIGRLAIVIPIRRRRDLATDPLLFTAGALTIAIVPVATLGVVLESPFGAVPFWWSAGVLYFLACSPGPPQGSSPSPAIVVAQGRTTTSGCPSVPRRE